MVGWHHRLDGHGFEYLHFHALQKEMATHSSVLAWRIPGTGEPGGLYIHGVESKTTLWASQEAQMVKNPPVVQETWVRSLGQEAPWEKAMGTHSSILAWRIPWIEETGRLQSMGWQRVGDN